MNIEDLQEQQPDKPPVFVNMRKVICLCHYREVWVTKEEPLPFFCNRMPRLLPPAPLA